MTSAMDEAIATFDLLQPTGCSVRRSLRQPLYTLVRIEGWPSMVHYEFRAEGDRGLCVELHVEKPELRSLGQTLKQCAGEIGSIQSFAVDYAARRIGVHRKRWPSVLIALPAGASGASLCR